MIRDWSICGNYPHVDINNTMSGIPYSLKFSMWQMTKLLFLRFSICGRIFSELILIKVVKVVKVANKSCKSSKSS